MGGGTSTIYKSASYNSNYTNIKTIPPLKIRNIEPPIIVKYDPQMDPQMIEKKKLKREQHETQERIKKEAKVKIEKELREKTERVARETEEKNARETREQIEKEAREKVEKEYKEKYEKEAKERAEKEYTNQNGNDELQCCICLDEPKTIVLMPCKHMCMCEACAFVVDICPICRKKIKNRISVFI
jgi:hypothetical protein